MPGSTVCTLTEGFRNEQIWKLWFKLCDYLNVVRFSDLIWNLIYWYSRTVLTLSIIVWHFHNFEAVYVSLHIKLFIGNKKLYLILLYQISWDGNRREIWTLEKHFVFCLNFLCLLKILPKKMTRRRRWRKRKGKFNIIAFMFWSNEISFKLKGPLFITLSYFKPCSPLPMTSF